MYRYINDTHEQEREMVETLIAQYCQDVTAEGKPTLDLLDLLV